jgi:hypothetical protein
VQPLFDSSASFFVDERIGWYNNPSTLSMHPTSVVTVKYEDDDVQIIGGTL